MKPINDEVRRLREETYRNVENLEKAVASLRELAEMGKEQTRRMLEQQARLQEMKHHEKDV